MTRALVYGLASLLAVVLPLVLAGWSPAFVSMSYGRSFLPFELLGLSGGLLVAGVAWVELRRRRPAGAREWIAFAAPFLLALHFLTLTSEYAQRRFDYDCYEYAGRALLADESPYRVGLIYLYPPPTAQAFAWAHRAVGATARALGADLPRDRVWDHVFYLYQCAQWLLVVAAYFLCLRFARVVGLDAWWSPVLVGALLVFDNAVFRTLRHGQVNLWVLDLSLLGLLMARARPWLGGAALALAAHVKLYPLLAALALAAADRWRAVLAGGVVLVAVFGLSSLGPGGLALWQEYADLLRADFPGEIAFRNASLHSLFYNLDRLWLGGSGRGGFVVWGVRLGTAAFALWLLARLVLRERVRRSLEAAADEARVFAGHTADVLAFGLLLSPSVWEHHFVMALPLAILAIGERGRDRGVAVFAAVFAMLWMPTFDVFLLGHHRLAGMLVLLALTSPRRVPRYRT
ncbi:MAG: glycosyltransferase 87 family protein [Myxococcota bacterium]